MPIACHWIIHAGLSNGALCGLRIPVSSSKIRDSSVADGSVISFFRFVEEINRRFIVISPFHCYRAECEEEAGARLSFSQDCFGHSAGIGSRGGSPRADAGKRSQSSYQFRLGVTSFGLPD